MFGWESGANSDTYSAPTENQTLLSSMLHILSYPPYPIPTNLTQAPQVPQMSTSQPTMGFDLEDVNCPNYPSGLKLSFTIFRALMCLAGTVVTLWILSFVKQKKLAVLRNPNAKVLFVSHVVVVAMHSFVCSLLYTYEIIIHLFHLPLPTLVVLVLRSPAISLFISISLSLLFFALERVFATSLMGKYDQLKRPFLAYLFVPASIVCPGIAVYFGLIFNEDFYAPMKCFTMLTLTNRQGFRHLTFVLTGIIILSLAIFLILMYLNRRINAKHSLSARYQENIELINFFRPIAALNLVLFLIYTVPVTTTVLMEPENSVLPLFQEGFDHIYLYGVLMSFIIYWRIIHRPCLVEPEPKGEEESTRHFNALAAQWERHPMPSDKKKEKKKKAQKPKRKCRKFLCFC